MHERVLLIVGAVIHVQHIFHLADEGRIVLGWDTPFLFQPRLERVSLSVWRTVSCERCST